MDIINAIKSGKPFRKVGEQGWFTAKDRIIPAEDILAEWEIKEEKPRVWLWECRCTTADENVRSWELITSYYTEKQISEFPIGDAFGNKHEYRKSRLCPPEGWEP